jgi:hypothetical protein
LPPHAFDWLVPASAELVSEPVAWQQEVGAKRGVEVPADAEPVAPGLSLEPLAAHSLEPPVWQEQGAKRGTG